MNLQKDVTAPAFKINDVYGRQINLEAYKNKKLLIGFFRHAGCPFCNLRVHKLSRAYEELKAMDFEMIFFFESKDKVILRSAFHRDVSPIPIISDPEKVWYDTYGLEESAHNVKMSLITSFVQTAFKAKINGVPMHLPTDGESPSTMPAEFLLDKNLVVKKVHYSQRLYDRMEIEDIKEFVKNSNYFE